MKFKLTNIEENTTKDIITPLAFKKWLSIHFGAWGFYHIEKISQKRYYITDKFDGTILYQIDL